jgi:trimethylamine--corrinoid protein Co-methyltransferase
MLDFESCQSLEKLVLDDEICAMVGRLRRGIEPRDDFPSRPLFEELLSEGHLLIADHTRRHRRDQIHLPGPAIERASLGRWREEGETTLGARAAAEVERLIAAWTVPGISDDVRRALRERMGAAAAAAGMSALPPVEA